MTPGFYGQVGQNSGALVQGGASVLFFAVPIVYFEFTSQPKSWQCILG